MMPENLIDLIAKAASAIPQQYLHLTTTYEPSGIVRERVFCYELYHQLRLIMGDNHRLTLNGEIDKRGHRDFTDEDKKNPDFVFHIPGQHTGNTIVTEVKGKLEKEGILKDFQTLLTFVSKYQYQLGVFLLYNHTIKDLTNLLGDDLDKFTKTEWSTQLIIITLPKAHCVETINDLTSIKMNQS